MTYKTIDRYPNFRFGEDGSVERWYDEDCWTSGGNRTAGWNVTKISQQTAGYLQVRVHTTTCTVHRLICEAFHGPAPLGHEVDHIDDVKTNNAASNLRWVTKSVNVAKKWTKLTLEERREKVRSLLKGSRKDK